MARRRAREYRTYMMGQAAGDVMGGYEVERPRGSPTVEGMVLVPLLQSAITAVPLALLVTWGLIELDVTRRWWPILGVLAAGSFLLTFLIRCADAQSTLWTVERFIGQDLDGDDVVGDPDHPIILANPARTTTPAERKRAEFVAFVRALATGDTSRGRFEDGLGRARYEEFRDALLQVGAAQWVDADNHRQGWELVADPADIVRAVM